MPTCQRFRGHQRPSEVIRGHQRSSAHLPTIQEVIRGHQRPPEAITEGEAHLVKGLLRLEDPHLVRQLVAVAALAACELERVCAKL